MKSPSVDWQESDRLEAFGVFGGRIVPYNGVWKIYLRETNSELWSFPTKEEAEAKFEDAVKKSGYGDPIRGIDWDWCEDCDHGICGGKPCESCKGSGKVFLADLLKATQQHVKELKAPKPLKEPLYVTPSFMLDQFRNVEIRDEKALIAEIKKALEVSPVQEALISVKKIQSQVQWEPAGIGNTWSDHRCTRCGEVVTVQMEDKDDEILAQHVCRTKRR